MEYKNGYYLIEVLTALFIFSYVSLSLFKYQWQLIKTTQMINAEWYALFLIDNVSESLIAGKTELVKPFQQAARTHLPEGEATVSISPPFTQLSVRWRDNHRANSSRRELTRFL